MGYGRSFGLVLVGLSLAAASGCARITTQLVDKPRVDQEIQGNGGYLQGSSHAPVTGRKTTRQMIQTDIELPTADEMNPWRKKPLSTAPMPAAKPAEQPSWQEPAKSSEPEIESGSYESEPASPKILETYTVKKGDTLEKISKKFYGTTRKWKKIYDANRDVLKSPDRLYVGKKLQIPALENSPEPEDAERNFK